MMWFGHMNFCSFEDNFNMTLIGKWQWKTKTSAGSVLSNAGQAKGTQWSRVLFEKYVVKLHFQRNVLPCMEPNG